jgi:hypothetical protein
MMHRAGLKMITNLKTLRHPVVGKHGQAVDVVEVAQPFALEQSPDVGDQNLKKSFTIFFSICRVAICSHALVKFQATSLQM